VKINESGRVQVPSKLLPPEYTYAQDDPIKQRLWKGIQRQQTFHQIAKDCPVIVEADPKIISQGFQPQFQILDSQPLRRQK